MLDAQSQKYLRPSPCALSVSSLMQKMLQVNEAIAACDGCFNQHTHTHTHTHTDTQPGVAEEERVKIPESHGLEGYTRRWVLSQELDSEHEVAS